MVLPQVKSKIFDLLYNVCFNAHMVNCNKDCLKIIQTWTVLTLKPFQWCHWTQYDQSLGCFFLSLVYCAAVLHIEIIKLQRYHGLRNVEINWDTNMGEGGIETMLFRAQPEF